MGSQLTPEIADALKTARVVEFRLEDEFRPFGWEERLELAAEMRGLIETLKGLQGEEGAHDEH